MTDNETLVRIIAVWFLFGAMIGLFVGLVIGALA